MSQPITVRDSLAGDVAACQAIFAHYVRTSVATFDEEPPDVAEIGCRREALLAAGYPHMVAEIDGTVVGYTYAGPYRPRRAYRFTVENSVYVAPDHHRLGIARTLLTELIARCEAGPWRQMLAVIADPGVEASLALHAAFGFREVGRVEAVGFKFGNWVDTVLMQRALGPGSHTSPN